MSIFGAFMCFHESAEHSGGSGAFDAVTRSVGHADVVPAGMGIKPAGRVFVKLEAI